MIFNRLMNSKIVGETCRFIGLSVRLKDQEHRENISKCSIHRSVDLKNDANNFFKWLAGFLICASNFYFISKTFFFRSTIQNHYTSLIVLFSSNIMNVIGMSHEVSGNNIVVGKTVITIADSCTGLFIFFLLGSAVLSFPVSWKDRIQGLISSFMILFSLNLLRIVLIVAFGSRNVNSIWIFHVVVGQILIITGVVAYFVFWQHNIHNSHFLSDKILKKKFIRLAALFVSGYSVGTIVYTFFLQSKIAKFVEFYIKKHSLGIIDFLGHIFKNIFQANNFPGISFNTGCLKSPVIVVLIGILTCLPLNWKKKIILGTFGFIPVFYFYHLLRAVMTGLSFAIGASKHTSVIYNCYGQVILSFLGLLIVWYYEDHLQKQDGYLKMFKRNVQGVLVGGLASLIGGFVFIDYIMPVLSHIIGFSKSGYYDYQLTISTMPYFQLFIFFNLVWSKKTSILHKILLSCLGTIINYIFMIFLVVTIEEFNLTPQIGILKFVIIIIPFLLYLFLTTKVVVQQHISHTP